MMEQEIPGVSAEKSNDNFTEVYTLLGDGATLPSGIVTTLTAGTNVTLSGSTGNVTINASITGGSTESQCEHIGGYWSFHTWCYYWCNFPWCR